MAEPYNLTNVTGSNNVMNLFTAANQMTNNYFGIMILFMIWIIVFFRLKLYTSEAASVAASFITALMAGFLFLIGMISQGVMMGAIILLAVTVIIKYVS